MNTLNQEAVLQILSAAAKADSAYELFGSAKHKYQLRPPLEMAKVRAIEETYHISLPEDYLHFITQIGDGGAGPDYGLYPFADFEKHNSPQNIRKPFFPHLASPEELKNTSIDPRVYERLQGKVFCYPESEEDGDEWFYEDGFLVLGTKGCQYDFIMPLQGEHRGKIFENDYEASFIFLADSFTQFYTEWLADIAEQKSI
jgi:hypothetical protein